LTAQRHPAAARVANRLRQCAWLHGDLAVPPAFRHAIRQQPGGSVEPFGEPRRVTHYIGGLGAGGSERQLCNLVTASAARGIATRVLTAVDPVGANGHYAEQLHAAGVSVSRAGARCHPLLQQAVANLPMLRLLDPCPPFLQPYMLDMLGEIMVNPPHVLHCWLDLTNIWAGVAGLLADVPAIVLSTRSVNPTNFPGINNPWFKTWYQALAESPRVHFINNSTAGALDYAQWLGLPARRFEVIRNGVDLSAIQRPTPEDRQSVRRELGLDPDAPVLIGVLRMTEEKQPMLFFQAGLEVVSQVPDAHVLLVGSGPFEQQLAEAIAAHGIGQRFHLLGQRRDVYRLMAASDLLLLTSRLEGTPNVLLEAQWMGCPVATTPAGGAVDALADGVTGIVVDGGEPSRLCDQVVDLMQDRPRLQAMGRAGPAFVAEHFSVERMVDETLALYQRALHLGTNGRAAAQMDRKQGG
jgi:glycosyltransferase involved in cell wall biosynthesis